MNMITKVESEEGEAQRRPLAAVVRGLSRRQKISVAAFLVGVVALALVCALQSAPCAAAPPPPSVTVASPLVREIAEWDDYSGRFEASKSVEVRPRVSGAIVGVHFTDGAVVQKGQLLFTIDARP